MTILKFARQSFCSSTQSLQYINSFLDFTISNSTLADESLLNKCILKQLASAFRRVRVFVVIDYSKQDDDPRRVEFSQNDFVCSCGFRLFLAKYNILIKRICPRFNSYCADQVVVEDACDATYDCNYNNELDPI